MSKKNKNDGTSTKNNGRFLLIVIVLIVIIVIGICALGIKNNSNDEETIVDETALSEEEGDEEEEPEEYVTVLDDETKLNNSSALAETKTYDGLEISNIQLTYDSTGNSVLLADVKNTTDSLIESKEFSIDLLDSEGETLATLPALIQNVAADATVQLNVGISADIANAYDFTIHE